MDQKLILITLLIRLGVVAAIASAVVRSRYFKSILFRNEIRSTRQQIQIVLFVGIPVALGVWVRATVPSFSAADVAFESAIIVGVMGGRLAGVALAALCAIPELWRHEFLAFPLDALAGYVAGAFREYAANREDIWSFSPMVDLSVYRWIRRNFPRPRHDWQVAFFVGILLLQFLREQIGRAFPGRLFFLRGDTFWVEVAVYAGTIAAVAIPIKIWNATRIELKLEEQERLLLQARLDALQSQINPHFLFNTLNSISSLVRVRPEQARELIVKLANILRSLLRKHDAFVLLREEVEFIDNYLDIEVARFGPEKLQVLKDLDSQTLDVIVPSMMLQPIVENAIKHGLAPKIEGGKITVRSRLQPQHRLRIEIEDDGVGMAAVNGRFGERRRYPREDSDGAELHTEGIGMHNVAERLRVLYGANAHMAVQSSPGRGTRISIELPLLQTDKEFSAASAIYEARSSMRS
ncbi:MAG: sensor histidine kinase [Acidobacteria bacterium]|nr:MAG: sensor histidine kinase [Acidobacteriota bacterium]